MRDSVRGGTMPQGFDPRFTTMGDIASGLGPGASGTSANNYQDVQIDAIGSEDLTRGLGAADNHIYYVF